MLIHTFTVYWLALSLTQSGRFIGFCVNSHFHSVLADSFLDTVCTQDSKHGPCSYFDTFQFFSIAKQTGVIFFNDFFFFTTGKSSSRTNQIRSFSRYKIIISLEKFKFVAKHTPHHSRQQHTLLFVLLFQPCFKFNHK